MRATRVRSCGRATLPVCLRSRLGCVVAAVLSFTIAVVSAARVARAASVDVPSPRVLPATAETPAVVVYPPSGDASTPRPVTVMLHGMCDVPENECPWFANVVTRDSWLVCPRGPTRCPSGGATWSPAHGAELIDAAIRRVELEYPGAVAARGHDTLIGFSLGAFVAMDVVNRAPTRWSRVVLLGAKIVPDPRALSRGSTRLILGAGEFDLSFSHMTLASRRLRKVGIDATFRSLGRVGHRFADDMDAWLSDALQETEPLPTS
jgi:predicted esterase